MAAPSAPKEGASVLSSVRSAIRLIGLFTDDMQILGVSDIDGAELAQLCRVTLNYMEALGSSRPRKPVLPRGRNAAYCASSGLLKFEDEVKTATSIPSIFQSA
jgi:hypothetical protein